MQRVGIESVLIWSALKNLGFKGQIEFIPAANSKRQKVELAKGNADFIGYTLFRVSVEGSQQFSAASYLVNKQRPEIYKALQDYLDFLRTKDDLLSKAFIHANNISQQQLDWQSLN